MIRKIAMAVLTLAMTAGCGAPRFDLDVHSLELKVVEDGLCWLSETEHKCGEGSGLFIQKTCTDADICIGGVYYADQTEVTLEVVGAPESADYAWRVDAGEAGECAVVPSPEARTTMQAGLLEYGLNGVQIEVNDDEGRGRRSWTVKLGYGYD